jgi:polysaccharide biosynthesis transport protein
MDTIDRPDSNVPARYAGESPRMPVPISAPSRDMAVAPQPSMPQVTPRILIRGLSRHWWRIMLFWLVVSAPLAYLIYAMVEPTFEATSLLLAEPTQPEIYGPSMGGTRGDVKAFLLTQVQLITSNTVLDAALAKPGISNLPMIRSSKDPKTDLHERLTVAIVMDGTYLIRVGLPSRDPDEASKIVNAVVDAYIEQNTDYHKNANRALKINMETELDKLAKKIQDVEGRLLEVVDKGKVTVKKHLPPNIPGKDGDAAAAAPEAHNVTEAQYTRAAGELFEMDIKLIDAQSALDSAQAQLARALEVADARGDERKQKESDQFEARIREEFSRDPEVRPLIEQINETKDTLVELQRKTRQLNDPAVVAAKRRARKLTDQWGALWEQKHKEIAERLQNGGAEDQRPEALAVKIKDLEAIVEQLKQKKVKLAEMVDKLEIETTHQNGEQLRASILNQEMAYLKRLQESVKVRLAQLEFEIGQEAYRISVHDKAGVPKVPSNNKRMKYMAVAPVGVLFALLGLFLLVEVKAERVGDPDALSTRMQSEVYALPPLPTVRSLRKRLPEDADDQIEQFIQRLDHLRFAVCGNPAELEKGRCVLITSAIGGEGKSTLAAQLAARCGQAGMSTLLIDADLRRTGLCSLLDVPEGPGLSDALTNDEPAPTELVIPVQGGAFHLLPAGTPISDTSRVLQNRKLGLLIAQFRQIYDLVIIDCPPVLPVPDALILGRWVDGAVLAVRYDISRFPQVERARRQLDGAGIAILGTVINGMKNSDSYYGKYSYSRKRFPQTDSPTAL